MTVYGSKTTEFGESPPETLAWLMMLEIVREETARRCCGPPPSVDAGELRRAPPGSVVG